MSTQPLTWVDLAAWCRLQQQRFTGWELDTLLAMDAATLRELASIRKEDEARAAAARQAQSNTRRR